MCRTQRNPTFCNRAREQHQAIAKPPFGPLRALPFGPLRALPILLPPCRRATRSCRAWGPPERLQASAHTAIDPNSEKPRSFESKFSQTPKIPRFIPRSHKPRYGHFTHKTFPKGWVAQAPFCCRSSPHSIEIDMLTTMLV